jgi:hypothetical protein
VTPATNELFRPIDFVDHAISTTHSVSMVKSKLPVHSGSAKQLVMISWNNITNSLACHGLVVQLGCWETTAASSLELLKSSRQTA